MYWEQYSGGFQQAVRWGKWKGHLIAASGKFELYDLSADQMETTNLAEQQPDVVKQMRDFMSAAHVPTPNWLVKAPAKQPKSK
jgi:hypothetical protein